MAGDEPEAGGDEQLSPPVANALNPEDYIPTELLGEENAEARTAYVGIREKVFDITGKAIEYDLRGYMAMADQIIQNCNLAQNGVTDLNIELIRMNLIAHFTALRSPPLRSMTYGDAREDYTFTFGEHLKSTRFGQAAINLDPTGCLARASQGKVAKVVLLSTS